MKQSKDFNEGRRKNTPSKLMPIINSCLTVLLFCLLVYFRVQYPEDFSIGYFIIFLIILILFPFASWYNSYFSKKQNTKQIDNFEKESNLLVEYARRYKEFTKSELTMNQHLLIKPINESVEEQIIGKIVFDKTNCSLGYPDGKSVIVTVGISFAGFEIDLKTNEIIAVSGMLPRSIWIEKRLKNPIPKRKATLIVEPVGFLLQPRMMIQLGRQLDIYYDKKSGWCCIGSCKHKEYDDVYQIAENAMIVLQNEELSSLWINIGIDQNV
jgi:hypothetical protein